jgi:hypothetical protein
MSKKIRLNEIAFLKKLVNSFLNAKADEKEDSWIDTLAKHDEELASLFGDFSSRMDKNYMDTINKLKKLGYDVKPKNTKDTEVYKIMSKYLEEWLDRRYSKK